MQSVQGCVQAEIKQYLVELMLAAERAVRRQLSEALALVAAADFPAAWPKLLPELVSHLANDRLAVKARLPCALRTCIAYIIVSFMCYSA